MGRKQSIVQRTPGCFLCGKEPTEEHHVFFGIANRKLSDQYGLTVRLCPEHHRGRKGVHQNREIDLELKKYGQMCFERTYPELSFREIFGRMYKEVT